MREALARYTHAAWTSYMQYFLNRLEKDSIGNLIIPEKYVKRLMNLINTGYDALSEEQKGYDLEEADKILTITNPSLKEARLKITRLEELVSHLETTYL